MSNRIFSGILVSLLLISMLTSAFIIKPVKTQPTTIIVPDNYPTIQAAIDHAFDGDTIYVKAGTYYEQLNINKSISLTGEDAEKTIVDGSGSKTGIVLLVYDGYGEGTIAIENLTFQKATILLQFSGVFRGNIVRNSSNDGILWDAYGGGSVLIDNNTFLGNWCGMEFDVDGPMVTVRNNRFVENRYSFCLDDVQGGSLSLDTSNTVDGYPVYFFDGLSNQTINENTCPSAGYLGVTRSNNVTIQNVTVLGKDFDALLLYNVDNFTVTNVTTKTSYYGIRISNSNNGTIANNTFAKNTVGLGLIYSEYVNVYGNIFTNNTKSISINGDYSERARGISDKRD